MVQKSEELRESGAAPCSDASFAVVSLVSSSQGYYSCTVLLLYCHYRSGFLSTWVGLLSNRVGLHLNGLGLFSGEKVLKNTPPPPVHSILISAGVGALSTSKMLTDSC